MSFPLAPVDGELYTTALGTVYRYVLADVAWKIVSGTTGSGIVGPGTIGTIAVFGPDTTSVEDSVITQSSGNLISTGNLQIDKTSADARVDIGTTDTSKIAIAKTTAGNAEAYLIAYGQDYPTVSGGPDGGDASGGTELTSASPAYFEINQQYPDKLMHLSYRHETRVTVAKDSVTLKKDTTVANSALRIYNTNGGPIMLPFHGNMTNVGNTYDTDFSRDPAYGMVTLMDAGTLAGDGTMSVLVGDTTNVAFTGLLYVDMNRVLGGNVNGGGALLNIGTDSCGIIVNVIDQWGSFVTPPDATTDCLNFNHVSPTPTAKQKLQLINRYPTDAKIRYWFVGGKNGAL